MQAPLKTRYELVDFIRGISITLILIFHFHAAYPLEIGFFSTFLPNGFLRLLAGNGSYGVTLFFVTSGFLITSTSLQRFGYPANISPVSFYTFRFARIVPNMVLMLAIVLLLGAIGMTAFQNKPGTASMPLTVFSILTFWHNVLIRKYGFFNPSLNIFWSLSVEEAFYLGFPIVCRLLRSPLKIGIFCVCILLIGPLHRARYSLDQFRILYDYFSCFDAIAIGCLVALLRPRLQLPSYVSNTMIALGAYLMIFSYFYGDIHYYAVHGMSYISLATGLVLLGMPKGNPWTSFFSLKLPRLIRWMGQIAYELYLFHAVVIILMILVKKEEALGFYEKPLWLALFLLLSCTVASLISNYYSQPLNSKIRKFAFNVDGPFGRKLTADTR